VATINDNDVASKCSKNDLWYGDEEITLSEPYCKLIYFSNFCLYTVLY